LVKAIMTEMLHIAGLSAGYGASLVLEDVDLALSKGESIAVLGRNGVGKTTLLATIMGQTRVHAGKISWQDNDLLKVHPASRAHVGLGWVPQERWIFPSLSVRENLTVVARNGPWTLERVESLFPRLRERRGHAGNHLSGGEQQMLAIGRALMLNPDLLLLDEPMEGLAPVVVAEIHRAIKSLVEEESLSVLLVEQKASLALSLAHNAIVLDRGKIVHRSDSATLLANPKLLGRLIGPS
jgi:branched-chain amino acid transport system ATP-binding protein